MPGRPDLTTLSGCRTRSWKEQPRVRPTTGDARLLRNPSRSSPTSHPACIWGPTASAPSGQPQEADLASLSHRPL